MLEIRSARTEELREAAQCIGMSFFQNHEDLDDVIESYRQSLVLDTVYDPENTRIVRVDGEVVGVTQIANRKMMIGGELLPVGVILWVGVHPEYRCRGIGEMMLTDALETLRTRGYDLSMLFGEGKESFYERAGWRSLKTLHKDRINLMGELAEPEFAGEIAPIDWKTELDGVLEISTVDLTGATGPVLRDHHFWMEYSARPPFDYPIFLVARREGRVVAYLRSGYQRAILETGCLPGAADAVQALILYTCRAARKAGLAEIDAIELPAMRYRLQSLGLTFHREPVQGQMYRVIHLRTLLEHLQDVLTERWQQAGLADWHGSIRLHGEDDEAMLKVERTGVHVLPAVTGRAQMDVILTQQQMINLLLGQANHDLLRVEGGTAWKESQQVLRALFPTLPFRWYPKDSF
jgi:predicted N-acetyltransferase YhbS